jgi:hypothetical protein
MPGYFKLPFVRLIGSTIERPIEGEGFPVFAPAQLATVSVGGIAPWPAVRRLFGPRQDKDHDVRTLIALSFAGLTVSLFAIERCPSLVAAIAAFP